MPPRNQSVFLLVKDAFRPLVLYLETLGMNGLTSGPHMRRNVLLISTGGQATLARGIPSHKRLIRCSDTKTTPRASLSTYFATINLRPADWLASP